MARLYGGTISYTRNGQEFGREFFNVTVGQDDTRTLRCLCEIDDAGLVRDVTYTVRADFRPIDCFVRVTNQNRFVGTGWFQFGDRYVEGEAFTATEGRVSQRLEVAERIRVFGTHPLCSDIWKCASAKAERIGETQILDNCVNCSPFPNGDTGPLLARKTYELIYRGHETIEVAAGVFDCEHFSWGMTGNRTLHLYTAGPDYLPVRATVPEMGRSFDMVELKERHP